MEHIRQASNWFAQVCDSREEYLLPERSQVYRNPMAKPSKIFSLSCCFLEFYKSDWGSGWGSPEKKVKP